jgi:hypothetical protein
MRACKRGANMQTQAISRTGQERFLSFLLRWVGAVSLLALVAAFMPYAWMDGIHRALGMGTLPATPIVGYLARSLSLFYALMGGLLLLCSFNPLKHRTVLYYLGAASIFIGMAMLGIDFAEGMPKFWKQLEGPYVTAFGILILVLLPRIKGK